MDVPIGPNGEVPSEFCPTRYLAKDPDTGRRLSVCRRIQMWRFHRFGHGMRACPGGPIVKPFTVLADSSNLHLKFSNHLPEPKMATSILPWSLDCGVSLYSTKRGRCCQRRRKHPPVSSLCREPECNYVTG
jgi:hypothetical protein